MTIDHDGRRFREAGGGEARRHREGHLVRTSSTYRSSPPDRWLRDTTTMCRHVVAQDRVLRTAGAHLLGDAPVFPPALGTTR